MCAKTFHRTSRVVSCRVSNKKEGVPGGKKDENNENISDREAEDDLQEDSDKDQDSDVSFQEEADEDIDATDKEEEWIDFIKRSTEEAEEHMKKHKLPCWIEVHKKDKMEDGTKNHHFTPVKMEQKSI